MLPFSPIVSPSSVSLQSVLCQSLLQSSAVFIIDMEYNIEGGIISDNSFGNEDHQEQQPRIGSDSSNTDDHSPTEYESGSEGDFNIVGNAEIGPSSRDLNTVLPRGA
ncbi:hypothetical protein OUZ56_018744 [Daphnia magna]|uniref:Uncharacterized protein n=1 Tax=Daphnia magna TaxID=35525 RepID=A0ABQ9ZAT6_9CRUS|nr:hypothetical protein OUZ56_018744 [Daphnia magna]